MKPPGPYLFSFSPSTTKVQILFINAKMQHKEENLPIPLFASHHTGTLSRGKLANHHLDKNYLK